MWGAFSDERTGLSFTVAAGRRQRSHSRVRVSWNSRLPLSSPPATQRAAVEAFDPAPAPETRVIRREITRKYAMKLWWSTHMRGTRIEKEVDVYATNLANKNNCMSTNAAQPSPSHPTNACAFYILCYLYLSLNTPSVVWNSITCTDPSELNHIHQKSSALYFNRFLFHVHYRYADALGQLKLHSWNISKHLDALSLTEVYLGSELCPLFVNCSVFVFLLEYIYQTIFRV
jgi:hypothetical protein